jgi:hypothetical protein
LPILSATFYATEYAISQSGLSVLGHRYGKFGHQTQRPCLHPLQMKSPFSPCHPDRSEAQWRDLRFSGPFLGMFFDRGVIDLWPTQGDEKRLLFSNDCRWRHRPPLCHLDRSVPGFPTSHCRQRPRVRFPLRKPHDDDQRHGSQQEIRGSVVDLQSLRTFRTQWNPSEMLRSDVQ